MATLLDVGILNFFQPVFTFLLVFAIVYGILIKAKPFGEEHTGLYAIIAAMLGFLVFFVPGVNEIITIVAPLFIALVIFGFLALLAMMLFGAKEEHFLSALKESPIIMWVFFIAGIFIIIFAFSQVYGEDISGDVQEGDEFVQNSVRDILFHPKLLGVIFLLIAASFAIKLISMSTPDK